MPDEIRKTITVDTVERFQGSERDIIIYSFATNNTHLLNNVQSITKFGNSEVDRKLNVAMTRAKHHLILLGNREILSKSSLYRELIEYIEDKNGFYDFSDFETNFKINNLHFL